MIKSILFDLDDTLIQTYSAIVDVVMQVDKKYYQLGLTEKDVRAAHGFKFHDWLSIVFRNIEPIPILEQKYLSIRTNNLYIPPHNGSIELMYELNKLYKLGLISTSQRAYAYNNFISAGFEEALFEFLHFEEDSEFHKPDPRVFDPVFSKLKKHKIDKASIVYVGDNTKDYLASRDAGIHFVGVATGIHTVEDFLSEGLSKEFIIEKLADLPRILKKINSNYLNAE